MVARTKVPNPASSTGTAISVRGYASVPNQHSIGVGIGPSAAPDEFGCNWHSEAVLLDTGLLCRYCEALSQALILQQFRL